MKTIKNIILLFCVGVIPIYAQKQNSALDVVRDEITKLQDNLYYVSLEDIPFIKNDLLSLNALLNQKMYLRRLLHDTHNVHIILKNSTSYTVKLWIGQNKMDYPTTFLLETGAEQETIVLQANQEVVLKRVPYNILFTLSGDKEVHELFSINHSLWKYKEAKEQHKDLIIDFNGCYWGDCSYGIESTVTLTQ